MKLKHFTFFPGLVAAILWSACSNNGSMAIFKKMSPHDQYGKRLTDAGLDQTAMGRSWILKADETVNKAFSITIPYKETGYFDAAKVNVTALQFNATRGQLLHIVTTKKPLINFAIYTDLLQMQDNEPPKIIAWADTTGAELKCEIKKSGKYMIRLQPELLRGGEYTLTITAGPSLGFPVSASGKPHIGSFWGDGRDEGGRKHEGVDIFALKHTPAIAADPGIVSRVTENNLGGKVVFVRPDGRDYNLYYAHLDEQLVHDGQIVRPGDTIGLVGNTGNARTTPAHLHFGIYTNEGAVDPLPFINREVKQPAAISAPISNLNTTIRTSVKTLLYTAPDTKATGITIALHTPMIAESATDGWYKVTMPDGQSGYVKSKDTGGINILRNFILKSAAAMYDAPDSAAAACKMVILAGTKVNIVASYKNYYLVNSGDETGWINAGK